MTRRTQGIKEPSLQNWLQWEKNTFRHQHLTSIMIKMAGMNLLTLQRSHQSHPTKHSHSKQKCMRACTHTHTHTHTQRYTYSTQTHTPPHTHLSKDIHIHTPNTHIYTPKTYIHVIQSLSHVQLFVTPWTAACQDPCPSRSPRVCSNSCQK